MPEDGKYEKKGKNIPPYCKFNKHRSSGSEVSKRNMRLSLQLIKQGP